MAKSTKINNRRYLIFFNHISGDLNQIKGQVLVVVKTKKKK